MPGETGQLAFTDEGDRLHPVYWIKNVHNGSKDVVGFHGHKNENNNILTFGEAIVWPSGTTKKPEGIKISTELEVSERYMNITGG